jgi:tetratricopeptide (TPR) repeat protein
MLAVLLAGCMAPAQTANPQPATTQPTPAGTSQSSAQSNQAQPAATTPLAAAANPSRPPQAKTREEYDAYKAAAALTDPTQVLAAADQFAQKYPTSELRALLYVQAMNFFQQQNNAAKEIEAGRKAIAIDPTDPIPLIHVGSALVEVTRDNDLDKEQRWAEAEKDLHGAIDNLDTGMHIPPNVTPEQVKMVKDNVLATAYESLGVIQMQKQNFGDAEADFQKAVDVSKAQPIGRIYLRLSVAQDDQKKYQEALVNANKALQYAQQGSVEQTLAQQQQIRLQKLLGQNTGSEAVSPSAPPPSANTPPGSVSPQPQPPPQPH